MLVSKGLLQLSDRLLQALNLHIGIQLLLSEDLNIKLKVLCIFGLKTANIELVLEFHDAVVERSLKLEKLGNDSMHDRVYLELGLFAAASLRPLVCRNDARFLLLGQLLTCKREDVLQTFKKFRMFLLHLLGLCLKPQLGLNLGL